MSGETLTLRVPGMYCPKCEERMAMALDHLPGVELLRADHVREEIELRLMDGRAPLEEVRRRVEALGFRVEPISSPAPGDWLEPAELNRQIVEGAPEAIIAADASGVIRAWNAGAERIFGFTADEAIGQSLDIIIPEPQRARHWEGYRRVMETGVTKYGSQLLAVPALRRDGARISVEFHVVLLRDAGGKTIGIAATMRDVTERWHQDRARRQQIRDLEAELAKLRG